MADCTVEEANAIRSASFFISKGGPSAIGASPASQKAYRNQLKKGVSYGIKHEWQAHSSGRTSSNH